MKKPGEYIRAQSMKDNEDVTYLEQEDSLLDSVEFIRLVYILKKNIWWVFLFFGICLAGALLYNRYTKPIYKSSSALKLEVKKTSGIFGLAKAGDDENNIYGEIEFIKSEVILEELANTLALLKVWYYKQGSVLADERFGNSPFKINYTEDQIFSLKDKRVFINILNNNEYELTFNNKSVKGQFNEEITVNGSLFTIEKTEYFTNLGNTEEYFFMVPSKQTIKNYLAKNISVEPINFGAKTIQVSFVDENKSKAQAIVNTVDKLYLKKTIEKKQLEKQSAIEYINDQLIQTKIKLDLAEKEIELFTLENRVSNIDAEQSRLIRALGELNDKKLKLANQLQNIVKANSSIQNNNETLLNELYVYQQENSSLASLLKEYEAKVEEFEKIKSTNKQITAAYQNSEKEILNLTSNLELRLAKQIENYQYELAKAKVEIKGIERKLGEFPSLKSALNKLQRSYQLYEGFYLLLEEKKIEYGIAKAGIIPNFTILAPASTPASPIYPQKLHVIAVGIGLAFVISFIFLFIKFLLYNTIISLKELEKLTTIPIVGTVPEHRVKKEYSTLVVHNSPKSSLSESLRSIRTNLEYFENNEKTKVVCFTSTISGEGKTFMSVNLAGILAMSDQKVVVLDLDMRKPKIHKAFNGENTLGMSDLLIGKAKINECIRHSELDALDYITSGTIPPNPSELIMRDDFDEVIEKLSKKYKFIFIDSPPAGLVTDSHILMKKCHIPIYVIKAGYSSRGVIKRINRLYQANQYPNFTLALNSVKHQDTYKNGYGGYGYGYGYYEDKVKNETNFIKKFWRLFTNKNLL